MNITIKKIWKDFEYKVDSLITKFTIERALKLLWSEVMSSLDNSKLVLIQFKVLMPNNTYRSVSYIQTVSNKEYHDLLLRFIEFWNICTEEYHSTPVEKIIFTYSVVPNTSVITKPKFNQHKNIILKNKDEFSFKGKVLPNNMDVETWGKILNKNASDKNIYFIAKNFSKHSPIYIVKVESDCLQIAYKVGTKIIFNFKDILYDPKIGNPLFSFIRIIKNQKYYFLDGKLVVKMLKRSCKYIRPSKKQSYFRNTNFITMDIETREIDNIMKPICVSLFDGEVKKSFYLSDFDSEESMIKASIKYLMVRKYNGHKVYIHNFSYFDSVFILKILSELGIFTKPIIKNNKYIDICFKFKTNESNTDYVLYFRDSYLLLPSSLAKLAKNFNTESKGIFPINLLRNNPDIKLDYKLPEGIVPSYDKFINVSEEVYSDYVNSFKGQTWDLRKEIIKYCEQDVVSLFQILDKFSNYIFSKFSVNITNTPTLPSLALTLYRCDFMCAAYNIPIITGDTYGDIRQAYTGGNVDMYKPYGQNVYEYDVTSLYPYGMKHKPMPTGEPRYFEGDIYLIFPDAFGYFEAEIITPENLFIPILQTKVRLADGSYSTISPLGHWTGWFFSEELKLASKYGYKIKINKGYLFEKKYIFREYVDYFFELKKNSIPKSSEQVISKLFLNSLAGKFGMSPELETHEIINSDHLELYQKHTVTNVINLGNGKELISYFTDRQSKYINISVAVAAAITSYGRIHMAELKMKLLAAGYIIYYSDTDSLFVNKPLDKNLIGNDLGLFKFENLYKEAVFLCPKVRGGITNEGEEIVKMKGVKNPITFNQLKSLLNKNQFLDIQQEKWYRNISSSSIRVENETYHLIATDNKRKLIYNNENILVDTSPYFINDNKII